MKIIVCLKQVPKNDSVLRVNEDGTWIQDRDLSYEINESDQYALEAALQLKEKVGGEVLALSLGPARVQTVIKEALARGADRGLHLDTRTRCHENHSTGPCRPHHNPHRWSEDSLSLILLECGDDRPSASSLHCRGKSLLLQRPAASRRR